MSEEKNKTKRYILESLWTLLIGGLFGYFVIAHLIPGAIDFYKEMKYGSAIEQVIDQQNKIFHYYEADKDRIAALKEIDVSECPLDFREAFYRWVEAYDKFVRTKDSFFHTLSQEKESGEKFQKYTDELFSIAGKYMNLKDDDETQK